MHMQEWEAKFEQWLLTQDDADAAHGLLHIGRVVENAKRLAHETGANLAVVVPAAWLHDCVSVPKNSPLRSRASRMAAELAGQFLRDNEYDAALIAPIQHAIEAHSFSAEIPTQTLEAEVVQDADRLDSLGAIGIARCLMTGVSMQRELYNRAEPFPITRKPDDSVSTLDHFYTKLLKLASTMKTEAGRSEAQRRTQFMQQYLDQLADELQPRSASI